MSIQIKIYDVPNDVDLPVEVSNANLKNSALAAPNAPYYLYPIRRPESNLIQFSFTNKIFAEITGTYSTIKRLRWKIDVPDLNPVKSAFYYSLSYVYSDPTISFDGNGIYINDKTLNINPRTSDVAPTSATDFNYVWTNNKTVYTDYLQFQLAVQQAEETDIGNIPPVEISLSDDLYE